MKARNLFEWRQAVLKRDNYTCRECGLREKLVTHHRSNDPKLALETENGMTLCRSCHAKLKPHSFYGRIHIYPSGITHLRRDIVEGGFLGMCDIYTSPFALIIAQPKSSFSDIIKSLRVAILKIRNMEKVKSRIDDE